MTDRFLLYSLAELGEVIFQSMRIAGSRALAEVGSEQAIFTRDLAQWAEDNDATVYCVEPAPTDALLAIVRQSANVSLVQGYSPKALLELPPIDAYLLDGDHNYHTVFNELAAIYGRANRQVNGYLIFLQDVGWPCARRDFYYSPDRLPPEAVHPYAYNKGVAYGVAELVDGGFRGEGNFAWALQEGGPRNGVLTALEDFLALHQEIASVNIPCVFGLAILFPRNAPFASEISRFLGTYDNNPLLARLEENRLRLYVQMIQLQDELQAMGAAKRVTETKLLQELETTQGQVSQLLSDLAAKSNQLVDLQARFDQVVHSRHYRLARWLGRLIPPPLRR